MQCITHISSTKNAINRKFGARARGGGTCSLDLRVFLIEQLLHAAHLLLEQQLDHGALAARHHHAVHRVLPDLNLHLQLCKTTPRKK